MQGLREGGDKERGRERVKETEWVSECRKTQRERERVGERVSKKQLRCLGNVVGTRAGSLAKGLSHKFTDLQNCESREAYSTATSTPLF